MTDMVVQLGQFLYNNTADAAIEGIAAATGIDKSTVAVGTAVLTTLGAVAGGAALTFKYGDTCRKKLSRNNSATPTPTVQEPQPNPMPENPVTEMPQLGGGETTPNLGATPTDEANATENATLAAVQNVRVDTSLLSIGQRVGSGELKRKCKK